MSSTDVPQTGRQGPNLTVDPIASLLAKLAIPAGIGFLLQLCTIWSIAFGPTAWALHLARPIQSTPWVRVRAISF